MPLVPYETAIGGRSATQGGIARPVEEASNITTLDVAAAALRQNNIVSGAMEATEIAFMHREPSVYDPNYDPLTESNLAGYEQHAVRFIGAESEAESQRIKARIDGETADQRVLDQAGGWGVASAIAAGLIDPVTIASMALPGGQAGTLTRGQRIARMAGTSAVLDTGTELALQSQQELRTAGQSVLNIAAGTLLTGALGVVATRMPKKEFEELRKVMEQQSRAMNDLTQETVESTAGAARVGYGTTLEDETVAKGGEALLKSLGKISPLGRVMQSSSKRARILMQELADLPFILNKHLKGIATPRSAEGEILGEQAERYRLIKETDSAYVDYRQAGGGLTRKQFGEEIAATLRRGDESMDPAVSKVAKVYRKYFDDSLKDLKKAGLVPEGEGVQFAMSYLPRLYDHGKIAANRSAFEDALTDYFSRSGQVELAEVRTAVADVVDTVMGSLRGHAQISPGFVGTSGSVNARTLNVPDEVLEPWLVNDIEKIMESYVRSVKPQLVLKNKFGEMDLRQQMQDVRDEYVAMRERAKSNEAKNAITKEMEAVLDDIQATRDMLLGKYATPANPDSALIKTGRAFRTLNYVRLLGGQVLSSIPDAGRVVARHGLLKTGATIARLVTDAGFRQMSKATAHRVGTALEWVLNTRGDTLAEIGDQVATSKLDARLRSVSNNFSRVTGMASWNSALKTLAVALEQDAIVRAAKGGAMSNFQKATLAQLGIGERMIQRIGKMLEDHGEDVDELFRSNAEKWKDREAADAFEGALLKSADQFVLTKGVADVPRFMSTEIGKTLFQFKSFGMASVNRMLIPMAQGLAHRDLATMNGAMVMLALGAMANAARDTAAGYKPATDPARIAVEAFDRAGFTSFLAEPLDLMSGLVGGPRFGRFTSQSLVETAGGPTFGTAQDIYDTMRGAFTEGGKFDPKLKASDVYRFRKLMPYQNLFYLRRLVNALEGEFSEAAGAEGAGTKSFEQRLTESKDLKR